MQETMKKFLEARGVEPSRVTCVIQPAFSYIMITGVDLKSGKKKRIYFEYNIVMSTSLKIYYPECKCWWKADLSEDGVRFYDNLIEGEEFDDRFNQALQEVYNNDFIVDSRRT